MRCRALPLKTTGTSRPKAATLHVFRRYLETSLLVTTVPSARARSELVLSPLSLASIDVEWPPEDYHRWQRTRVQRTMHPVPFELKALSAEQRVVDTSLCHRHLLYGRHLHGTALDTSLCLERAKGAISNTHASSLSSYDSPPPACRATSFHLATLYLGRGMGR